MGATNAYDNYYLATPYMKAIQEGKYIHQGAGREGAPRIAPLLSHHDESEPASRFPLLRAAIMQLPDRIAEEGIVFFQNRSNVLPINTQKAKKVLVVGENAIKMMTVGGGSFFAQGTSGRFRRSMA